MESLLLEELLSQWRLFTRMLPEMSVLQLKCLALLSTSRLLQVNWLVSIRKCTPCPKGFTCCGKAFGKCICKRPKIGSCCIEIPDPVCEGKNAAYLTLKKPIEIALKGAKVIGNTAQGRLNAAKAALIILQIAVTAAQTVVDGAIEKFWRV